MPDRAPSSPAPPAGIGLALADALRAERFGLTLVARKPAISRGAAPSLRANAATTSARGRQHRRRGSIRKVAVQVHRDASAASMCSSTAPARRRRAAAEHQTKFVDMQLGVNLRSIILFYRESLECCAPPGRSTQNAAGRQPGLARRRSRRSPGCRLRGHQGGVSPTRGDEQGAHEQASSRWLCPVRRHRHERVRQDTSRERCSVPRTSPKRCGSSCGSLRPA